MSDSTSELKKKLMQAEVKIRQLTQATVKDLKVKIKQKQNEIEVLKEMVKSSGNSLKAKDIDIQRLNKRIHRLEKLVEINNTYGAKSGQNRHDRNIIPERDEEMEDTHQNFEITGIPHRNQFGLNEQVNQELLQHQIAGKNNNRNHFVTGISMNHQ